MTMSKTKAGQFGSLLLIAAMFLTLFSITGCKKFNENPTAKVTTVATGLMAPMGLETDRWGNIWVAETGTANNDGKVVIISRGMKSGSSWAHYDAIVNLSSIKNALSGEEEGPAHLLLDNGMLYVLAGDFLYKFNVANFKPGDPPIDASAVSYEDVGSYVRSLNIVTPNDSHPYNLIKGPDGNIYITDAGANAIIKRTSANHYSVLAEFPPYANPNPGPPMVQMVPTGIIFDGRDFLVSTLTGYPFLPGKAVIYRVSLSGKVSVYQSGLSTLVDIADGNNLYGHVVLHFGSFGATDFEPNTGSLMLVNGAESKVIKDGLNMPSGLKQINAESWYVSSLGDGTVMKISYE